MGVQMMFYLWKYSAMYSLLIVTCLITVLLLHRMPVVWIQRKMMLMLRVKQLIFLMMPYPLRKAVRIITSMSYALILLWMGLLIYVFSRLSI